MAKLDRWIGRKLTLPADLVPEAWGRRVEVTEIRRNPSGKSFLWCRSETTGRECMVDPKVALELTGLKLVPPDDAE